MSVYCVVLDDNETFSGLPVYIVDYDGDGEDIKEEFEDGKIIIGRIEENENGALVLYLKKGLEFILQVEDMEEEVYHCFT